MFKISNVQESPVPESVSVNVRIGMARRRYHAGGGGSKNGEMAGGGRAGGGRLSGRVGVDSKRRGRVECWR